MMSFRPSLAPSCAGSVVRSSVPSPRRELEAVFEADGRLAHAAGRAAYGDVRESPEAVRRVDRARTDAVRREEVEALELWQGLVEERWSLIDRYHTDGRRYDVAMADGVDARQSRPSDCAGRRR
jgi:hypothetical protein